MADRDVVITGMGLLSPLGADCRENWENIRAGRTGISIHTADDRPAGMRHFGKIANTALPADIPPKLSGQARFLCRASVFGFKAAQEAAAMAAFPLELIPPSRRALFIASGDFTKVGYEFMHAAVKDAVKGGSMDHVRLNAATLNKVSPLFLLESLHNNLFSFLSAYLEFMGPNTSFASLSPGGGQAIELACRAIRQNRADIAVAVGYGSWINEVTLYELDTLGLLSRCRQGSSSFRPFDRHRDGFITGEGGAALFLESAETARARGARILAKIRGAGGFHTLSEGRHFTVPRMVSKRVMELALADAGCTVGELAFILPHGSGTRKGDSAELMSLAALFSSSGFDVPICGLKPYTGHLGSASDIAEVIIGIRAIADGVVPATLNFSESDREFAELKISGSRQHCQGRHFLSVSYGIGSQSSSVVVEIPSESAVHAEEYVH